MIAGSHLRVSLLTVGSEILDGRVLDSNTHYLSQLLSDLGFEVTAKLSCDDDIEETIKSLEFLRERSGTIIVTGGLGPTADDLTREALAAFAGVELSLDPAVLDNLKEWYRKRGRTFNEANTKQALRPLGSQCIPNPVGTAPGIALTLSDGLLIIALPGVPRELTAMMSETVRELLREQGGDRLAPYHTAFFRLFGLPESEVGARVAALGIPDSVKVSYRASIPEVHVKLRSRAPLGAWRDEVARALGRDFIISEDPEIAFNAAVVELLKEHHLALATCESCTGGAIGSLITEVPGASAVYLGGFVCYANEFKEHIVGVPHATLVEYGAVSGACVQSLAEQTRRLTGASFGLSVSGVAGPEGGTSERPMGTFWVGLSRAKGTDAYKFFFPASREMVRRWAAYKALDLVRRDILGLPLPSDIREGVG